MTTVDPPRPVTGGVDTHLELNVAAALDPLGGLLDVAELSEILEYIVERLDTLARIDPDPPPSDDCWASYDLDQLRGDLVRFVTLFRACELTS
ncbi:MAG: hypothetical protein ACRD6W_15795 [Nitrososphaerales archaeon]